MRDDQLKFEVLFGSRQSTAGFSKLLAEIMTEHNGVAGYITSTTVSRDTKQFDIFATVTGRINTTCVAFYVKGIINKAYPMAFVHVKLPKDKNSQPIHSQPIHSQVIHSQVIHSDEEREAMLLVAAIGSKEPDLTSGETTSRELHEGKKIKIKKGTNMGFTIQIPDIDPKQTYTLKQEGTSEGKHFITTVTGLSGEALKTGFHVSIDITDKGDKDNG
jgi:hypothetical protein